MALPDPTTPLGQLRYAVGDTGDIQYLPDAVYQQVLSQNNNNVLASVKTIAFYILAILSQQMREKAGAIEVWGSDAAKNYMAFLNMIIKDPRTSLSTTGFYAGGLSKKDMEANKANVDNNARPNMHILRPVRMVGAADEPDAEYPVWL
jgi:hypothetical protein